MTLRNPNGSVDQIMREHRERVAGIGRGAKSTLVLLTATETNVITLLYHDGLTQAEAAGVLGVSQQRIAQIHSAALGKLREAGNIIVEFGESGEI